MPVQLTIPKVFDAHVHLREGEMLRDVVPIVARHCEHVLVMPNTRKAITTPQLVEEYRSDIQAALIDSGSQARFTPHMTFELREDTPTALIESFVDAGAVAGKVYPYKLTTNSQHGVQHYQALYPMLDAMQSYGLVLCLHGEQPGLPLNGYQWLRAEPEFLVRTLKPLAENFPRLKIVLEHISTAEAVQVVERYDNVYATITAHHLVLNHDDVGGYKMNVHNFCKPVAKGEADRLALVKAATGGSGKYFFGSDSAPHPRGSKECGDGCCAGCYTSPMFLPLLAGVFERAGKLEELTNFTSNHGMSFYGISDRFKELRDRPQLMLTRRPWTVPEECHGVVPFLAGKQLPWSVSVPPA